MTAEFALLWVKRLTGGAIFLQTVELIWIRESFSENGIWKWSTLRKELKNYPSWIRVLLDRALAYPSFLTVLWIRLFTALLFPGSLSVFIGPLLVIFLLISSALIAIRWRGTFNGGSDFMTLILLMALTGEAIFGKHPRAQIICLGYIALQTSTSYFLAGFSKLKTKHWRNGKALAAFLGNTIYPETSIIHGFVQHKILTQFTSWAIIFFECSFPLSLLQPQICIIYLGVALAFHLGNFYIFGLNRFVFAWLAAYPALIFFSHNRF